MMYFIRLIHLIRQFPKIRINNKETRINNLPTSIIGKLFGSMAIIFGITYSINLLAHDNNNDNQSKNRDDAAFFQPYLLAEAAKQQNKTSQNKIDINQADAETIAANLKGIGLKKAQAIVQFRNENGPFYSAEELTQVKGIGPALANRIASQIITAPKSKP